MNTGKINFKYTPEQIEIVKKMGSNNRSEALAAQEALAAVLTQPLLEVINSAPVLSNLFKTITYEAGTPASLALDLYFDVRSRNYLNIWTQGTSGGVATNFIQGLSEAFFAVREFDSAIAMNKSYLKAGRLDALAASMQRMSQEILIKQELNAADVITGALAGARIDGQAGNTAVDNLQIFRSATAGRFQMADFNTAMTRYSRIVSSWVGGTPVGEMNQITDLIGSPEFMSEVRSIAYQPQNTTAGSITSSGATAIAAPESVRTEIFRSAGVPSFFGVNLIQCYDLGINRAYNKLFANRAGATSYIGNGGSGSAAFTQTTEQLVIGLNANMFNLVRLRELGSEGEFTLVPDDQFTMRSEKIGFYGRVRENYSALDNRGLVGLVY